jgi:preprotein translocase subunit SecB
MEKLLTLIEGPKLCLCNFFTKKRPPKEDRPKAIECEITSKISIDDECERLELSVLTRSDSLAIPFSFEVEMVAAFEIHKKEENELLAKTALVEGAPIIFAVLRELVADLTRKSHFAPFYLPLADFSNEQPRKFKKSLAPPIKPISTPKKKPVTMKKAR